MQNASAAAPTYTAITRAVTKSHAPWLMCGNGLSSLTSDSLSKTHDADGAKADVFGDSTRTFRSLYRDLVTGFMSFDVHIGYRPSGVRTPPQASRTCW